MLRSFLHVPFVLALGCSGGRSRTSPVAISCSYRVEPDAGLPPNYDGSSCADYSGEVVPTSCPATFREVPSCATEGWVGRCDTVTPTSAGESRAIIRFYPPQTTENARAGCDAARGTFTAP